MTETLPKKFVDRLKENRIIPFVGAGVSMAIKDKMGGKVFPSWVELLSESAKVLRAENKIQTANEIGRLLAKSNPDCYLAAEIAKAAMGQQWFEFLSNQFDPKSSTIDTETLALPRSVWSIGSQLIITTNYDRSLIWSCEDAGNLTYWDIQNLAGKGRLLAHGLPDEPTVWYLHGYIGNPQRIVLTLDGYEKLYPGRKQKKELQATLATLRTLLAGYSFLFIGFSMRDRFVSDQLSYVHKLYKGTTGEHFILTHPDYLTEIKSSGLPVNPILFEDYGDPLLAKINEIAEAAKRCSRAETVSGPETKTHPYKIPVNQRLFNGVVAILIGIGFLGTMLDSISNALQLITPIITYVLTIVAVLVGVLAAIGTRRDWFERVDKDGRKVHFRFELNHYLQIVGVVILLWVPRGISCFRSEQATEFVLPIIHGNSIEENIDSLSNFRETSNLEIGTKNINANSLELTGSVGQRQSISSQSDVKKRKKLLSTALAKQLYGSGKYAEALNECNRILRIQPTNADALWLRANIRNTLEILSH